MGAGELNIPGTQRADLKDKAEHLFWDRPLSLFDPVLKTVKANLGDTLGRFQFDPSAKAAAKAVAHGESWRTKIGRFLGEKGNEQASWIGIAARTKHTKDEE